MHADQAITVFKALADKTRLDIVRFVAQTDCATSCNAASSLSPLSQPAMSHHFGILVKAGVLSEQKNGKQKFYELNTELLDTLGIDPTKL
jgi:DNA-binding transcriptional ArsR family regulator